MEQIGLQQKGMQQRQNLMIIRPSLMRRPVEKEVSLLDLSLVSLLSVVVPPSTASAARIRRKMKVELSPRMNS